MSKFAKRQVEVQEAFAEIAPMQDGAATTFKSLQQKDMLNSGELQEEKSEP
jgi:hypothetical protein